MSHYEPYFAGRRHQQSCESDACVHLQDQILNNQQLILYSVRSLHGRCITPAPPAGTCCNWAGTAAALNAPCLPCSTAGARAQSCLSSAVAPAARWRSLAARSRARSGRDQGSPAGCAAAGPVPVTVPSCCCCCWTAAAVRARPARTLLDRGAPGEAASSALLTVKSSGSSAAVCESVCWHALAGWLADLGKQLLAAADRACLSTLPVQHQSVPERTLDAGKAAARLPS